MAEGDLLGCCGCAGLEAALYLAGGLGGRPEELGEAGPDAAVPLLDEEGAASRAGTWLYDARHGALFVSST